MKISTQNLLSIGSGYEAAFLAYIQFGTPGYNQSDQQFGLLADTGSSWIWVYTCDFTEESSPMIQMFKKIKKKCPEYYFNPQNSTTIQCTGEKKAAKYGSGKIRGEICNDFLKVNNTDDMKARVPFLEEKAQVDFGPSRWDGILGLSPSDESAGPLLIPNLFDQGKIRSNMFSFLPAKREDEEAKLTYGGYQEEGTAGGDQYFYNEATNRIVAHQVSGSFHWEIPLKKVVIGDNFSAFRPQVLSALTDTGTTIFIMYYKDLEYFQ